MTDLKILKATSGQIVNISVTTTEALLGGKKNPMKDRVTKTVRGTAFLGREGLYKEMLTEAMAEAGEEFDSDAPLKKSWGEREDGSCIINNKGNPYVEIIWVDTDGPEYFLDGNPIPKADIEGIKPSRPPSKNEAVGVIYRRYKAQGVELLD